MRPKPLLTASQVSGLLSTAIVLLFTTALFLSGFAIQRRTLRTLRAAIRPKPSPFDAAPAALTQLLDGTVVAARDARLAVSKGNEDVVVEVVLAESAQQQQQQQQQQPSDNDKEEHDSWWAWALARLGYGADPVAEGFVPPPKDQQHPDPRMRGQQLVSRAERRRLIKEEMVRLATPKQNEYHKRMRT